MKITFIPLGGGNTIGDSSYLFQFDDTNILIDAGNLDSIPPSENVVNELDRKINGIANLDAVLITHAHKDHVGSLLNLISGGYKKLIYSSQDTKYLSKFIFEELMSEKSKSQGLRNYYTDFLKYIYSQWITIDLNETVKIGNVEIKPFSSGHLIGAYGYIIKYKSKTIVITGDASSAENLASGGLRYPQIDKCDYLICDGTNLNNSFENYLENDDERIIRNLIKCKKNNKKLIFKCNTIGKDIEILLRLNRLAIRNNFNLKICIKATTKDIIDKLNLGYKFKEIKLYINDMNNNISDDVDIIINHNKRFSLKRKIYELQDLVFSEDNYEENYFSIKSHLDINQIELFLDYLNPEKVYFVHTYCKRIPLEIRKYNCSLSENKNIYNWGD